MVSLEVWDSRNYSARSMPSSQKFRLSLGEFPNSEAAREWYESEEYRAILPLRLEATTGTLFFVEGITMPPMPESRQD